ncbi:hypothetical protein ACTA71_006536 [Dictyostelium dimigraforme]
MDLNQIKTTCQKGTPRFPEEKTTTTKTVKQETWVNNYDDGVIKLEQPRQRVLVEKQQTQIKVDEGKDNINVYEVPPEIIIKENATDLDVIEKSLRAEVTVPAAQVEIQQPAPRIFLDQHAPIIDVNQMAPRVEFIQREPIVSVNQPKASVIINQQKPEVQIQASKPVVSFAAASPPNINVSQQEPLIKLFRSEPIVRISEFRGTPEIILQKSDSCVLNVKPMPAPILTISKGAKMASEFSQTTTQITQTGTNSPKLIKKEEILIKKDSDGKTTKFEKRSDWLNEKPMSPKIKASQF